MPKIATRTIYQPACIHFAIAVHVEVVAHFQQHDGSAPKHQQWRHLPSSFLLMFQVAGCLVGIWFLVPLQLLQ